MIFYIIVVIVLLILIGLVIWLLVRQTSSTPTGKKLGETCTASSECNTGLICSTGTTPVTTTTGTISVCKVAPGGVCAVSADCSTGFGCVNGVCVQNLGRLNSPCPCDTGFTCINNVCKAITGGICSVDTDCAMGTCVNGVCMASNPSPTPSCYSSSSDCSDSSSSNNSDCSRYSSNSSSDCNTHHKDSEKSWSWSKSWSDCNVSSSSEDKHCKKKKKNKCKKSSSHSYDNSECSNDSEKHHNHHKYSTESSDCNTNSSRSSDCGYLKRGVYSTNQNNNDQNVFTNVEMPIIDIAKPGSNFMLLLGDGNLGMSSTASASATVTYLKTNKKMIRMVRFGNELVAIDERGKLYTQKAPVNNSGTMYWNWEKLCNFPKDAIFINSVNNGTYLEVVTSEGKAYLYQYSSTWMNGTPTSKRKTCTLRFYGKDTSRYIDINQDYVGVTNDNVKYKHIKAAGFYTNNTIVQVLTSDSFTHVRVIDDRAYFLFEQC